MSQQVGTGFSFTDKGGLVTNEEQVAEGLYSFITQFLTIFSEYQKNDFYITGEVRRSFVSTCVLYVYMYRWPFFAPSLYT